MGAFVSRALCGRRHVRCSPHLSRLPQSKIFAELGQRTDGAAGRTRRIRRRINAALPTGNASLAGACSHDCRRRWTAKTNRFHAMTPLYKAIRRVTVDEYGYGRRRRKLVVALEKGDLITIRELGRRTKHTARLYDVLWWLLRCEADKVRMEKLRDRKSRKAARLADHRQRTAERRLSRNSRNEDVHL